MKVRVRRVSAERISVPITTEFIKLESFLKLANAAGSGDETCTMRGKKLRPGDSVRFNGAEYLVADAAQ